MKEKIILILVVLCVYSLHSNMKTRRKLLGEEKRIKTENNTTYSSPFILSDDPSIFVNKKS